MTNTKKLVLCCGALFSALLWPTLAIASAKIHLEIRADASGPTINRDIFGQFAEHLGEGVYGGIWVGPDSPIPNVRGIRSDVVAALRQLNVPNVRWPGGCFADRYNWRDGIGPRAERRATINASWGNVLDSNAFGTHEFMDFLEQIGSEPFVVVNVGSGSVREASDWLEYMTAPSTTTLGKLRSQNGRDLPWKIKYVGIGNESWSCGGNFSAANYVQQLKTYTTFLQSFHPEQARPIKWVRGDHAIQRVAVGPEAGHPEYTEAIMAAWQGSRPWTWGFEALDLHYYAMGPRPLQSPATGFNEDAYAYFVDETLKLDGIIAKHSAIMDKYDPEKKVALIIGEWGTWLAPLAGSNPNFLKQQNSMRDAILASLNFNIFARHADRVRGANVAQTVNVLQAMALTEGPRMVLTPTYHVFRMYVPFQDAQYLPVELAAGDYRQGAFALPQVSGIAARAKDGTLWLAVTNIDPANVAVVSVKVTGARFKSAAGEVLSAERIDAINSFSNPHAVTPKPYIARATSGELSLRLPPGSVVVVKLER